MAGVEYLFVEDPSPAWEQFRLPDLLDEHRVDLYHSPAFSLPLVKTCRYLPTVHDCIPVLFPHLVGPDFAAYFRRWAPRWFRSADHLLCNSAHTAHDLTHLYGVAPEDLSVVEHTGNPGFTEVTEPRTIEETHRRLGIDAPFVLMVGRVELRKNVAGMLEAFALLRQRGLGPLPLVFAGARAADAHDPAGLLPPVGRHGDVLVTGKVCEQDLRVLYSTAAAYCFPSFYEGFGRPLLEAMQCGTPVVTTRVSSLPEVGGDACLYVSPYDAAELADALQRVLTDGALRERLVQRGSARARQFTAERMAAETLEVYERVGSGEGRRRRREVARRPVAQA